MSRFWNSVLSSKETSSSKRLITLIISAHFILASFVVLYIASYVIFFLPKGKVDPLLLNLLGDVLEKDFYIILSGLGFITGENLAQILVEKMKVKAAANIQTGTPTADTINVDTVNVAQVDTPTSKKNTKRQ